MELTRNDIENLTACNATDHLVAREVMGWTRTRYGNGGGHWTEQDGSQHHYTPDFSSKIEAAWSVVEKMRDRGFEWCFGSDGGSNGVFKWTATVMAFPFDIVGQADEPGMPLAICKASLLALLATLAQREER